MFARKKTLNVKNKKRNKFIIHSEIAFKTIARSKITTECRWENHVLIHCFSNFPFSEFCSRRIFILSFEVLSHSFIMHSISLDPTQLACRFSDGETVSGPNECLLQCIRLNDSLKMETSLNWMFTRMTEYDGNGLKLWIFAPESDDEWLTIVLNLYLSRRELNKTSHSERILMNSDEFDEGRTNKTHHVRYTLQISVSIS